MSRIATPPLPGTERPSGDAAEVAEIGLDAGDPGFIERLALELGNVAAFAIRAWTITFAQQGIVIRTDLGARRAIQPSQRVHSGNVRLGQQPAARAEVVVWILRIDAGLDRAALEVGRLTAGIRPEGSSSASRIIHSTRSMPVTSSVTPCSTCRRVFTSRKKKSSPVRVVDELDRSGGAVVHALSQLHRGACRAVRVSSG
jgi:hypothetical protein